MKGQNKDVNIGNLFVDGTMDRLRLSDKHILTYGRVPRNQVQYLLNLHNYDLLFLFFPKKYENAMESFSDKSREYLDRLHNGH